MGSNVNQDLKVEAGKAKGYTNQQKNQKHKPKAGADKQKHRNRQTSQAKCTRCGKELHLKNNAQLRSAGVAPKLNITSTAVVLN